MTFLDSMKLLLHAFPRWDVTGEAAVTWAAMLSDVEPEALALAAQQIARESKFPPTIAEWREKALTISGKGKAFEVVAAEAWAEVAKNRQIHSVQRYESRPEKRRPYVWTSEAVRRAAEMIDWAGDWEGEKMGVIRAQFAQCLQSLQSKETLIQGARETIELGDPQKRIGRELECLYGPGYEDPAP